MANDIPGNRVVHPDHVADYRRVDFAHGSLIFICGLVLAGQAAVFSRFYPSDSKGGIVVLALGGVALLVGVVFGLVAFADGLLLVAHNASFERSVINQTSQLHALAPHPFDIRCTLSMARALDKGAPNHKLDTLAARYGIEQLSHHDAGDDSLVGARLALHLLAMPGGGEAFAKSKLK